MPFARYNEHEVGDGIVTYLQRGAKGIFFRVEYEGILVWEHLEPFVRGRQPKAVERFTKAYEQMESVVIQLEGGA